VKPTRETDIVASCLAYLRLRKVPAWRQNTGCATFGAGGRRRFVRFAVEGCSDILGVLPPSGRLLAVEVKRPGGKLTPAQAAFIDHVRAAGGLGVVVRSVDDLAAALRLEGALWRRCPSGRGPETRRRTRPPGSSSSFQYARCRAGRYLTAAPAAVKQARPPVRPRARNRSP
jgi:hypothetical protein